MLFPFAADGFEPLMREIDDWAHHLDERVLPRRWAGRLRRALEAESVAASTSMEGVPVTVDDTMRILAGDAPEDVSQRDQALVLGYRDAMTYVQRRADDGQLIWNRELLVGVQDRVLAGSLADGSGRLRSGAAWVRNASSGRVVFEPPPHEEVPALVDAMCAEIDAVDWHPALIAAWSHVALAAIHPFKDGNGRTARVLASLAMYRGGFRHPAFTNLEEWWGRNAASYYAAFECLGSHFDPSTDVTPFVETHVRAQLEQVRVLALRQRTEGMLWTVLENLLEDRSLPPRIANALYDSFFGRDVTTTYYRSLIDASPATARNDLQAATAAGLLAATGRTRGRRYLPGPRLLVSISRMLGLTQRERGEILDALVDRAMDDLVPPGHEPIQPKLPGF